MVWGGGAALNELRRSTEVALDQLKDAFWQLDSCQRFARAQVEAYSEHLPERAKRSRLRPGFRALDQKAELCVADYLSVVDSFPMEPGMRERALGAARQAFRRVEPLLRAIAAELDGFMSSYSAEFALVGEQLLKVEEQKLLARKAVEEALADWEKLRRESLGSASADTALAKARDALRGVDAWQPVSGLPKLQEMVAVVQGFAGDLRRIATEYPGQVGRAQGRLPSMRTRVAAITTRSAGIAECLGVLRREFSLGNWNDLESQEQVVASELARARTLLDQLQEALGRGAWEEAIPLLTEAESVLESTDDAVDAPRERLRVLRVFREDPAARVERTRFALKDAQLLIVNGPVRDAKDLATRLDTLALRLKAVGPALEGVHPNYWAILADIDQIERLVRDVVASYRARAS